MRSTLLVWSVACAPGVEGVYDASRSEHYFDLPFPAPSNFDDAGRPDLRGFPLAPLELTADIEQGWIDRLERVTRGAANNGAVYFRFQAPLDFPASTSGRPDDPVVWLDVESGRLLPLDLRFVEDPAGDPHWGPNTLAVVPTLGHPPVAGHTQVVAVLRSAGAERPKAFEVPEAWESALKEAGIRDRIALATRFQVQDATTELGALLDDVDLRWEGAATTRFRRVVQLIYEEGVTPSGRAATVCRARYEEGGEGVTYLGLDPGEVQTVDLLDYPLAVFEAEIPVLNYQPEADRPYLSPGFLHITDVDRQSGAIVFDAAGRPPEPWVDTMRIVVGLPKGADGALAPAKGAVLWDHGTGGHAYNIIQRANAADQSEALAQVFAEEGWAVVGRDATLYGTRYPLIDEGHGSSLGFYNIVNLPAFRDNQRQTAIEGYQLARWLAEGLERDLPGASVDLGRIRRAGHSLGSVTSNLGVAGRPSAWESVFLSGTGGVFSHYFLDTGLLATIDPELVAALFPLLGAAAPETLDIPSVAGAVLGVPQAAWSQIDRTHPLLLLFQWTMDPSDPMAVARDERLPAFVSIAPGDYQTPDFTAEALAVALPQARVVYCEARGDYDPHSCLWREPEGPEILREWLQGP